MSAPTSLHTQLADPSGPRVSLTATAVAVVGANDVLADHARSSGTDVHHQRWSQDGEPLAATLIGAELAALGVALVCIADDVPVELAMELASVIDREQPGASVALIATPDGELWRDAIRAGVRDVIEPSRVDLDLRGAIDRAAERTERVRLLAATTEVSTPTTGRVIVVVSPKGGSGKTMVSSNLAVALAIGGEEPVALVDLDVQFGDSASALGLDAERSIDQLVATGPIDSTALKVYLTLHEPSGAFVLCGPVSPEWSDDVRPEHAAQIIDLLAADFGFVVVDTPAGLDERTLVALERATDIVFVASTDVSSIRSMAKEVALLRQLGLLRAEQRFVLNRADAKVGVEIADVEAALGMTTDAAVPSSRDVPLAMNQGRPFVLDSPNSTASRELSGLADRIAGRDNQRRLNRLPWRR